MNDAVYDELADELTKGGPEAALARLAERMKAEKQYHELFDARLMQARLRMGLPLSQSGGLDDLPEPQRSQVESAYLEACRETGGLLLDAGRVREAWMYLRPVGDRQAVKAGLAKIEPGDQNLEELIEVSLHEGIDPARGFELVLANYGTCNAVTMFDSVMHRQPRESRQEVAALLVRHLHQELSRNLRAEIARQEGKEPPETSIQGLVADRDWLFSGDNYHIDTSHLQAVVRFGRFVTDPAALRLAADLTEYGRRLSRQYQYAGEDPFLDAHPAHALFFRAQLGEQVQAALDYFRGRAEAQDAQQGTGPAEVYVALLARLGQTREALEAAATLIPAGTQVSGFAPSLTDLARQTGEHGRHKEICRQREDVLGYAAALVEERLARPR